LPPACNECLAQQTKRGHVASRIGSHIGKNDCERTLPDKVRRDLTVITAAAREMLALHDRLMLAKEILARKGRGRRTTPNLPRLAELLLAAPLVTVPLIAQDLKISPQAAQILIRDLGPTLREITGRQGDCAWTIGRVPAALRRPTYCKTVAWSCLVRREGFDKKCRAQKKKKAPPK
jgi:hypothetical protein